MTLYDAKTSAFVCIGVVVAVGMTLWSRSPGLWTISRGLLCIGVAAIAILGAATLHLRQDYRARSERRRDAPT